MSYTTTRSLIIVKTILVSFIFYVPVFAQNTREKADSLIEEVGEMNNSKLALLKADSAINISSTIHYGKGIRKGNLAKANVYLIFFDSKAGLKIIKNIEPEVLKSNEPCEITLLNYIRGGFYTHLRLFDEASEEFNKTLLSAEKITDDDQRHYSKARAYFAYAALEGTQQPHDHLKILSFLNKANKEARLIKENRLQKKVLLIILNSYADFYIEKKDFNTAKKYLEESLIILKTNKNKKILGFTYFQLGRLYYQLGEYDNAIKNYQESISVCKLSKNMLIIEENYKGLALVYEKLNNKDKQNEYLKLLSSVNDSVNKSNIDAVGMAVGDITKDIKTEHNVVKRKFWLYLIFLSVFLIIFFYFVVILFRKYRIEKFNREELEALLNEKMAILSSYKDRDQHYGEDELKNVVRLAMTNDPNFTIEFEKIFPHFRIKLLQIQPTFRNNDLKFCSYLKLNFDTKEIARYSGDSVRAVESKKYRLRKKLNLSSSDDIYFWLSNM